MGDLHICRALEALTLLLEELSELLHLKAVPNTTHVGIYVLQITMDHMIM